VKKSTAEKVQRNTRRVSAKIVRGERIHRGGADFTKNLCGKKNQSPLVERQSTEAVICMGAKKGKKPGRKKEKSQFCDKGGRKK